MASTCDVCAHTCVVCQYVRVAEIRAAAVLAALSNGAWCRMAHAMVAFADVSVKGLLSAAR